MAFPSRDWPGNREHAHIGSAEYPTHKVAAFAPDLDKRWASLFCAYVKAPDLCVHCANNQGRTQPDVVALIRSYCSERFMGRCVSVDGSCLPYCSEGEAVFRFGVEPPMLPGARSENELTSDENSRFSLTSRNPLQPVEDLEDPVR